MELGGIPLDVVDNSQVGDAHSGCSVQYGEDMTATHGEEMGEGESQAVDGFGKEVILSSEHLRDGAGGDESTALHTVVVAMGQVVDQVAEVEVNEIHSALRWGEYRNTRVVD